MDFTNIFVILFTTGTVFDFVLNQFLEFTDYSSRKKNGTKVPAEIKGLIDEATLKKTCSYENAKYFMWIPRAVHADFGLCSGILRFLRSAVQFFLVCNEQYLSYGNCICVSFFHSV